MVILSRLLEAELGDERVHLGQINAFLAQPQTP